jgi:hypothetical protein
MGIYGLISRGIKDGRVLKLAFFLVVYPWLLTEVVPVVYAVLLVVREALGIMASA